MNFLVGYDYRMVFSIVRLREVSDKQEFAGTNTYMQPVTESYRFANIQPIACIPGQK